VEGNFNYKHITPKKAYVYITKQKQGTYVTQLCFYSKK